MTRTLIVIAAVLTLSVPAALAVPPAGKGKPENPGNSQSAPGQSATKNAAKACKAERGTTPATIAAYKTKYKSNGLGKCIAALKQKTKKPKDENAKDENAKDEAKEEEAESAAEKAAEKECKAERGTTAESIEAFKKKHGTNHNKANAMGKCVSKLSKSKTS